MLINEFHEKIARKIRTGGGRVLVANEGDSSFAVALATHLKIEMIPLRVEWANSLGCNVTEECFEIVFENFLSFAPIAGFELITFIAPLGKEVCFTMRALSLLQEEGGIVVAVVEKKSVAKIRNILEGKSLPIRIESVGVNPVDCREYEMITINGWTNNE